jgi:CRP-like cAMP-binding protein
MLYRQGAAADRILFVISGHVEITTTTTDGTSSRVAVLGPGNHCGDLRLTVGERRAESAIALDDCVVRSLSRQAITAGLTGLLDRTAAERQIVESLLRTGPGTREGLLSRLPGMEPATFATSLALLMQDGAVRESDGVISAVLTRAGRTGSRHILDRLGDL